MKSHSFQITQRYSIVISFDDTIPVIVKRLSDLIDRSRLHDFDVIDLYDHW